MRPIIATCFGVRKLRPSGYSILFLGLFFWNSLFIENLQGQCALACKGKVNLSLAEGCQAIPYPSQFLTSGINCPDAHFRVDILDYNMKKIPTSPVITEDYIGMTVIGSVYDSTSKNSCWTHVLVEEKNAPIILCRHDTVYCNDSAIYNPPIFFDYCDPNPTIKKTWEEHTTYPCDPQILKLIVRAWVAQDSRGNISLPCYDSLWLKRAPIDSVVFPKHRTVADYCHIECNANYPKDAEGHPDPIYSGYPTLHGNPIWPTFNAYCNLAVSYEDYIILKTDCKTKILRLWRVVEWWCSTANTKTAQQYIEIADTQGPEIVHCPYDITVSTTTSYLCQSNFLLPEIEAKDACQDSLHYEIYADGSLLTKNNGGNVTLELGDHDIEYRVFDKCYNSSTCRIIVTVEDKNPPVAVCQQGIVVSMSRSDSIHVYAEVFDDGSHDECHLDSFLVRRMDNGAPCLYDDKTFRPYVSFCCEDVGKKLMVVFRAKDQSGNVNDCMVEVEIQDKSAPVIKCPHDYEMPCTQLDTVHLSRFGYPNYYDNCVVHMHEYVDTALNQCRLGYLQRNFVIEDNMQRRDTCFQRIHVYNPKPFVEAQITWPRDTIIYSCGRDVDPKTLPEDYAYPKFRDVECSLPGHNYVDDVFNYIQDSSLCFKVLRRWTVIDWCQQYYDSATSSYKFASWTHLQLIKVANKVPPKIQEKCDTITKCLTGTNCISEHISITHSATDDCTPDDLLRSSVKLDLYNNGLIDSTYSVAGNVISWDGNLPLGVHRIIWVFEDQCGNHIVCDQIVRIYNCKIPTAYCLTGVAVNLGLIDINGDGTPEQIADVWAADIDHGSYQQCGNPVVLSFSRESSDKFRRYNCDSLGQRKVELWVTDRITGYQDRCISTITVQDNNKICRGNLTNGKVAGLVSTPDGRPIPATVISLDDPITHTDKISSSSYSFDNLPLGRDYKIKVSNDQNYLDGISTLDIIGIQKHILGKTYFENVWQYLAADVTNDEKITSADVAALRKLILGLDYKFKNSMSWKYVISNYQFPDPENPWYEKLPDSYYYPSIPGDMNYTDFKGVKVGDVSQSTWSGLSSPKERTARTIELERGIVNEKLIQIRIPKAMPFIGMQFTLRFNNDLNRAVKIIPGAIGINDNFINDQYIQNGILLVSWNDLEPVYCNDNSVLFSIEFGDVVSKELLESLEINSDVVKAELYDDQLSIADIRLKSHNSGFKTQDLLIGSPVPNPFVDVTTILLEAKTNVDYKYEIADINGQVILTQEGHAIQGKNFIKIKGSSLTNSGIYLLRIEAAGITRSFKLIKMEN